MNSWRRFSPPARQSCESEQKSENYSIPFVPLRTCLVSYCENDHTGSVEVIAETLHEAAVMGMKAMDVPSDATAPAVLERPREITPGVTIHLIYEVFMRNTARQPNILGLRNSPHWRHSG